MKHSLIIILIATLTGCISPQVIKKNEVTCEIIRTGIIGNAELTKEFSTPGTTSGFTRNYSSLRVTEETSEIPLKKNVHFGVEYLFNGLAKGEKVAEVVTHPLIKRENKQASTGYTRNKKPGTSSGYILNRDYELVAGIWKLEYFHNGRYLCGASFEVK